MKKVLTTALKWLVFYFGKSYPTTIGSSIIDRYAFFGGKVIGYRTATGKIKFEQPLVLHNKQGQVIWLEGDKSVLAEAQLYVSERNTYEAIWRSPYGKDVNYRCLRNPLSNELKQIK